MPETYHHARASTDRTARTAHRSRTFLATSPAWEREEAAAAAARAPDPVPRPYDAHDVEDAFNAAHNALALALETLDPERSDRILALAARFEADAFTMSREVL